MSLKLLSRCVNDLSNETLGTVVLGMVEDGDLSPEQFGEMVRTYLSNVNPLNVDSVPHTDPPIFDSIFPPAAAAAAAATAPDAALNGAELLRIVYGSFGNYRRRSVAALAIATGLSESSLLNLITGNADFRLSNGTSGMQFLSVRGVN